MNTIVNSSLMLKRTLLCLLVCLLCAGVAQGRPITEAEARQVATDFLSAHSLGAGMTLQAVQRTASHAPSIHGSASAAYYVYNIGTAGNGYVIVSGDDRTLPVLGYSDNGTFELNDLPPAMQEWMDMLANQINSLGDDETTYNAPRRAWGASVSPLIKTNWGQSEPYNNRLPKTNNGETAVTGCVATAMAQVMKYYNWPSKPLMTIPAYTTKTQSISMPALTAIYFSWASMQNNYLPSATGDAANAVAALMLYCAQSIEMDFKDGTSSGNTSSTPVAMRKYFDFAPSIRYLTRADYDQYIWESMLYDELKAKRPVIYRGQTMANGGHSFVCDGYNSNTGMFHFNWGWNSGSNGYFVLSALNPSSQGTGSSSGAEGYIKGQAMVVGIAPNNSSAPSVAQNLTYRHTAASTTSYSRSGSSANFTITWSGRFSNYNSENMACYSGWALYKGSQFQKMLTGTVSPYVFNDLQPGYGRTTNFSLSWGANETSGTYRIVPMCKLQSSGGWKVAQGGDVNYLEVTISTYSLQVKTYGITATPNYSVNSVVFNGSKRVGKTVEIVANLANKGTSMNDNVFLYVDGVKNTMAVANIDPGHSGDVVFRYTPSTTGVKSITISLNEDGTSPIASRSLTIVSMPEASLSMTLSAPQAVSTSSGNTVTGNTLVINNKITNNKSTAYDEDIVARVIRITKTSSTGSSGSAIRAVSEPVKIAANGNVTKTFTFGDLEIGQSYFVIFYYFSNGEMVRCKTTANYKMIDGTSSNVKGDANLDWNVDVTDVNLLIDVVLGKSVLPTTAFKNCDIDKNGIIDVTDVNYVIDIILGKE